MIKNDIKISLFCFVASIVLFVLLSSCNNKNHQSFNSNPPIDVAPITTLISKQTTDNQNTTTGNIDSFFSEISSIFDIHQIDIPIAVTLTHDDDFEVVKETDDTIYIDWSNSYYKDFISGKRIDASLSPSFLKGYLNVDIDIVNNSDNTLDIEELDVNVASSIPDSIPLVKVYTEEDICNTIHFANMSWFNWHGMSFKYSILKQGEVFDGTYSTQRHIDYFEQDTIINLIPDMILMGYSFEKVCKYEDSICNNIQTNEDVYWYKRLLDPTKEFITHIDDLGKDVCEKQHSEDFEDLNLNWNSYSCICLDLDKTKAENLFYPFNIKSKADTYYDNDTLKEIDYYYGYAKLYGELCFDNSNYCLKFQADINLSVHCEFGAGSDESDRFDVELNPHGYNYLLRYPYTTVIEPYGTERVSLIIKAEESSIHLFSIFAKNGNGINISSKVIDIHYMSPRNFDVLELDNENSYLKWKNQNLYEE